VGSPRLVDTHKPGSFTVQHFSSIHDQHSSAPQNSPSTPERSIRPPVCHPELSILCHPELSILCHPERSRPMHEVHRPAESKDPYSSQLRTSATSVVALRIFRPALETSVELDGAKPHFVQLWHRHRRVLAASGPWSSSGNWWNASAWTREEWDVVLKTPVGLGLYRIYRDRLRQQWFVEGVFD
jgi:hypothetical protein